MKSLENKKFQYLKTTHSYHLVDPSPWPFIAASGALMLITGTVLYAHRYIGGWSFAEIFKNFSFILFCTLNIILRCFLILKYVKNFWFFYQNFYTYENKNTSNFTGVFIVFVIMIVFFSKGGSALCAPTTEELDPWMYSIAGRPFPFMGIEMDDPITNWYEVDGKGGYSKVLYKEYELTSKVEFVRLLDHDGFEIFTLPYYLTDQNCQVWNNTYMDRELNEFSEEHVCLIRREPMENGSTLTVKFIMRPSLIRKLNLVSLVPLK